MPTITITIDTDNAAFDEWPGHEVARILRVFAQRAERAGHLLDLDARDLTDANGNRCGRTRVEVLPDLAPDRRVTP